MTISQNNRRRSAAIIRAPARLSISNWAQKEAWIPEEGNAEPGKYQLSRMPHQAAMLDDPTEPDVREIFWMLASQAGGKTLCQILICEFAISVLHKSLIMVRDVKDRALEWMRDKFIPTAEATPCMDGLLKDPRQRGSNSTAMSRRFPGGVFKVIGAKAKGAFRSTSAGIVLQDEIDAYEATKEGDPCALADRATITFSDAWKLKASTPTIEEVSRIYAGFLRGDQQRYFLPCPVCGEFQWLKWEQLKFTFTAEEHARVEALTYHPNNHTWDIGNFPIRDTLRAIYVCEHCHKGWTDAQRIEAYRSGHPDNPPVIVNGQELRAQWRATAPFKGVRSRHLSGLYLTIGLEKGFDNYLQQFAETFLKAKSEGRAALMAWTNMFLAWVFEDPHEKMDWKALQDRAEDYCQPADGQPVEVPAQVVWINFGMDIQQDRVEILSYGWGDAQECWALDHRVIYGDFDMPAMQERVADYLLNKRFKNPVMGDLAYSAGGIDSGHQTKVQAAYRFAGKYILSNFWTVKGFDQALGAVYERKKEKRFGGLRFNLNTDYLKNLIADRLRNKEPGPRYIHFPKKFEAAFYTGLCSERRIPVKQPNGGFVWHWVKHASSTRNETLDMTVYAFGIFEVCRQEEWIARKWKEVQAKLREIEPPAPVAKREVMLDQPAEAKLPELKVQKEQNKPGPARRKIRINSPFGWPRR